MALRGASGGYDRGMRGPSAEAGNNRTMTARRVTAVEGDPQNVCEAKFWGRRTAGRTPAGEQTRGYLKLEGAAHAFKFDFRGKTVLDIGSSTGGFTEYALDHGARKVIAVEKGSHQMKAPLRFDPRIELHEKTDIFDFKLESEIDTVVADVSFLSLTKILNYLKKLPNQDANLLMMLKPQFEAHPDQLKKGIVKNETIRRQIIKNFEKWLRANNYIIVTKHDNALHGKTGNIERFYYLKLAK